MQPIEYTSLSDPRVAASSRFETVHGTFLEAFSDYAVDMSGLTERVLANRMTKNGVDFEASVCALAEGRMVAFTLIGIESRDGTQAAFDAATGVIPQYRGRRLAGGMFEFARPRLLARGVSRFSLEVLCENEAAIKAYRRVGFRILRQFDCYRAEPANLRFGGNLPQHLKVRSVERAAATDFENFIDWTPSWECSFASLARIPDEVRLYAAYYRQQPAGLAAFYPGLGWIMGPVVDPTLRRRGIATALLRRLVDDLPVSFTEIRLINVDVSDLASAELLRGRGFKPYVQQYEMELALAAPGD